MFTYSVFHKHDREQVIEVINRVAAENRFLQTGCYVSSLTWENLLACGADQENGYLLLTVYDSKELAGFVRLSPDDLGGRYTGNVGIVLLPKHRYKRIGTKLLDFIVNIAPVFGYKSLVADILFDNFVSLRLFTGRGFTQCSSRNLYLRHRNAVVEEVKMKFFLRDCQGKHNVELPND